jgi:hypothetical protein
VPPHTQKKKYCLAVPISEASQEEYI